jgi:lysophospholipase L1-like esterase
VAAYRGINPEPLRAEVDRWNAAIAGAAQRHGAQLVDLHATWQEVSQHPEYLAADGFHPSSEGYARLAELFEAAYASQA